MFKIAIGLPPDVQKLFAESTISQKACAIVDDFISRNDIKSLAYTSHLPFPNMAIEFESPKTNDINKRYYGRLSKQTEYWTLGKTIVLTANGLWPCSFAIDVKPGDETFSNQLKIKKYYRRFKPFVWIGDQNNFNKTGMLRVPPLEAGKSYHPDNKRTAIEIDYFLNGRKHFEELGERTKTTIMDESPMVYLVAKVVTGILYMLANNILKYHYIPPTPIPGKAYDGLTYNSHKLVLVSASARVVITAPKVGKGTPQRWHERRGHLLIKGRDVCKMAVADPANLCDERTTSDPNKQYCNICHKRRTAKKAYWAGRNKQGTITHSYQIKP